MCRQAFTVLALVAERKSQTEAHEGTFDSDEAMELQLQDGDTATLEGVIAFLDSYELTEDLFDQSEAIKSENFQVHPIHVSTELKPIPASPASSQPSKRRRIRTR
ncbi:unnamed protein product [Phytophthora lilii]|uniref:Unnamed protein product n=1 Tax=Phytophthora lilii TaxID=2077276 RepID=A0A9W6WTY5_9STRA|nr:unnamed protein product [Phytophthora lilii]